MTAVGVAGLKMTSDAQKMNASLGQTAITLGVTTSAMRDMVLSVTNVDFGVNEVISTFDELVRAGVTNTDSLKKSATAFDTLGDATGQSADVVASELIPAYKALGQQIPQSANDLDAFTWLVKNTTVDLSDFSTVITRLAPEMSKAGLTINDVVIALAVLNEKGITGRKATQELGDAIETASAQGITLSKALGLTTDEVNKYQTQLNSVTGITQKYADVSNTQYNIIDKLKQAFSVLTLKVGSIMQPLQGVFAAMTALGPVMLFLSTKMGMQILLLTQQIILHPIATAQMIAHTVAVAAHAVAVGVATAAQWLWNVAMDANPIGLLIIAIAALIVAVILIAKNWDTVREKTVEIWNDIVGFLKGVWDNIVGFFKTNWALILAILFPTVGLPILIAQNWGTITGIVSDIWNGVVNAIKTTWNNIVTFVESGVNWLIDQVNKVIDLMDKIPGVNVGDIGHLGGQSPSPVGPPIPSTIPGYALGGMVSGAIGQPQLAVVHGGEIITPSQVGGRQTINLYVGNKLLKSFIIDGITRDIRLQGGY
jgi:hypothetical protein